jgi:ferredoxin--NADP+ reductase
MSFKIINKQILATAVRRIDIHAPEIVKRIQPGQFISLCPREDGERIPLTVVDVDEKKQTISVIVLDKGATTHELGEIPIGENIFSILGPLGKPAKIKKEGIVVCIATGIGTAQILPICRAYREAGNKIIGIIGAQTKRKLMLEAQMRLLCDKIIVTTEDGSYERKGLATDYLKQLLETKKVDLIYAVGAPEMMEAVAQIAKEKKIKTRVQLNPTMVECFGMCGSCRVKVGGEIVLACLEGPEFDGQKVDYEDYKIRMNAFKGDYSWEGQAKTSYPSEKGSNPFKKFLSGLVKN